MADKYLPPLMAVLVLVGFLVVGAGVSGAQVVGVPQTTEEQTGAVSVDHVETISSGETFEITVETENSAGTIVEIEPDQFDIDLSSDDAVNIDGNRVEFLDPSAGNSVYTIMVDVGDTTDGEQIDIAAWVNAEFRDDADDLSTSEVSISADDEDPSRISTFDHPESVTQDDEFEIAIGTRNSAGTVLEIDTDTAEVSLSSDDAVVIQDNRVEFLDPAAGDSQYTVTVDVTDAPADSTLQIAAWVNAENRDNADDEASSSISVVQDDPPGDPNVRTDEITADPNEAKDSTTVTVDATVTNIGDAGTATIPLIVNGETVNTTKANLVANESTSLSFKEQITEVGSYNVSVGDSEPTSVTVYDDPEISLSANETTQISGEAIRFKGTVENDLASPVERWVWTFPDGTQTETEEPVIQQTFSNTGETSVSLRAVDQFEDTSTAEVIITVRERPDATFQLNAEPVPNRSVAAEGDIEIGGNATLTAPAAAANDRVDAAWSANGAGIEMTESDSKIQLEPTERGEIEINLTVTDEADISNTSTRTLNVVDTTPPEVSLATAFDNGDRVGEANPIQIRIATEDLTHESTEVTVTDSGGQDVFTEDLSAATGDGEETALHWNAIDDGGDPVPSGTYAVAVQSTDAAGNENSTTETVDVDTDTPNVTIANIDGNGVVDGTIHANESVAVTVTADDGRSPANPVDSVDVALSSTETAYEEVISATQENETMWTTTVDLTEFGVSGEFSVEAVTVDGGLNTGSTTAPADVVYDESPPGFASVLERDGDDANISVRANSTLAGSPSVTVIAPNGTSHPVDVTETDDRTWVGSFDPELETTYNVIVTGADHAGNVGSDTTTVTMGSIQTENQTALVNNEATGTIIEFTTDTPVRDSTITVSESEVPPSDIEDDQLGIGFLTSQLDAELRENLTNATIYVPVDETALPAAVEPDDVSIHWYNETSGKWEPRETAVESVSFEDKNASNGDHYWTVTVDHFSTYGALVVDETSPDLTAEAPSNPVDADEVTVSFEYADELSGVDVGSVELFVDGEQVTDDGNARITDNNATYTLSVEPGTEYELTAEVADNAGNHAKESTMVIVSREGGPDVIPPEDLNGSTLDPDTGSVDIAFEYVASSVDQDETVLAIATDDDKRTVDPTVGGDEISYALNVTSGTAYTITLTLVTDEGVSHNATLEFAVDPEPAPGGGGGGGDGGDQEIDSRITHLADQVTAQFGEVPGSAFVTVDLEDTVTNNGVSVYEFGIDMRLSSDGFRVEMDRPTSTPSSAPALDVAEPITYIESRPYGLEDRNVNDVQLQFGVEEDALPDGATEDDVSLYYYADGSWTAADTTHLGAGEFEALTPEFAMYAVGIDQGDTDEGSSSNKSDESDEPTEDEPASEPDPSTDDDSVAEVPGFGPITMITAVVALLAGLRVRT